MSVNEKINEEEGILKNEPIDNTYSVIEPENMNVFPYFLLASLKCSFNNEWSEGVGLLIGDDIIMTSAHNLLYKTSDDHFLFPDDIQVSLLLNGSFKLFEDFSCSNFFVPEKFKELKKKELLSHNTYEWRQINEELVKYDYGIIFLPKDAGSHIQEIFNTKKYTNILNPETKLFNFFEKHVQIYENLIDPKNERNFLTDYKISLVSYTNYNSEYLKTPLFKYNSSFNILNKKYSNNKKIFETQGKVGEKFELEKKVSSFQNNSDSIEKTPLSKMKTFSTLNFEDKIYDSTSKNEDSCCAHRINFDHPAKIKNPSGNIFIDRNLQQISSEENHTFIKRQRNNQENQKYFLFRNSKFNSINSNNCTLKYIHNERNIKSNDSSIEILKFYEENSLVLCEAKGRLCSIKNFNKTHTSVSNNLNMKDHKLSQSNENLTYFITTYVGQSGSPLFLRIKKKYIYKNCLSNEYEYILIGFHSRCHVKFNECLASFTEDLTEEQLISRDNNISFSQNSILSRNIFNINSISKSNTTHEVYSIKEDYLNLNPFIKNSFIGYSSFSDFNIGFKLNNQCVETIKKIVLHKRSDLNYFHTILSKSNKILNSNDQFEFVYIDCFFYNELVFQGFFERHTSLKTIFHIVEKRLELDMIFLNMSFKEKNSSIITSSEGLTLHNIFSQNTLEQNENNSENYKTFILKKSQENDNSNVNITEESQNTESTIKKLKIFMKCDTIKLSEQLSSKVVNKIKDYDEHYLSKLSQKNKKTIIQTIKAIFEEINFLYYKSTLLHGILYSEIKEKIIKV